MSKSAEGLGRMMNALVVVFEAAGLTVSETRTEKTLLRTNSNQVLLTSPVVVEAAG